MMKPSYLSARVAGRMALSPSNSCRATRQPMAANSSSNIWQACTLYLDVGGDRVEQCQRGLSPATDQTLQRWRGDEGSYHSKGNTHFTASERESMPRSPARAIIMRLLGEEFHRKILHKERWSGCVNL